MAQQEPEVTPVMAKKRGSKPRAKGIGIMSPAKHGFEFGGPIGAAGITLGLPLACFLATFVCNDISGCPVPSVLHPSTLTLEKLKQEVGWPENGIWGLASYEVTGWLLGYYLLSLILQGILSGDEIEGVALRSGGRLKYKFNAFFSATLTVAIAVAGTVAQGPDFVLWTFIWDNYLQLLTASIGISFAIAFFVYFKSFTVKPGKPGYRELAAGGHTGNKIYDWFIGRELNPRIALPILGTIDIKVFCELRPGMLGWVLLDLAFVAHQYKTYGYVTDSIAIVTLFQSIYVFDALWMEPAILTTMDVTSDGFGFMLAFGDLVWVPFIYSLQAKYLAVYPLQLGLKGTLGVAIVQGIGYFTFRSANNQKNRFRTNPKDRRVSHLRYIETKSGSKLLVTGWWGMARHINYLGDWIMGWTYCLPTGIAGYVIQHVSDGKRVVQGEARGWGMVVTYFYIAYFAILLIHREMRDEEKCEQKYGDDWKEYQKKVRWRIVPYIY
ncbi:hypothetical protein FGG08_004177 [Glutinoglossum americanum]|uniref:Delta(14)-sterol reductase n=1 Tax=Glutinoglossum americanum TaxID=1670608 RepID=A0A9P8I5U1_9PEZI|nr:hypothetical protein FGG08_004177 [Glutinoglossum americanum]